MATYYFVGDGSEVFVCEAYRENAGARMQLLLDDGFENLSIYECDPSEVVRDEDGEWVWQYPAERAEAKKHYDLPTLAEVTAKL